MCLNTVVDVWRLFRKDHNWLTTLRILVNQTAPQLWSLRTSFPISSGSIRGPSLSTLKLRKGSLTALVPRVSVLQPAPSTKPVSAVKWDSNSNFCVKTKLPQPPPVRPPAGDAGASISRHKYTGRGEISDVVQNLKFITQSHKYFLIFNV